MKTDTEIKQDVLDELEWESSVDAAQIGVVVKNAVVTLTGSVNTYAEKNAAENAAKRVLGVKAIVDELSVRIGGSDKRTDEDIAMVALNNLRWNTSVPHEDIRLTVENGWITLEGTVDWNYQKEAARNAVKHLAGIRGVTNLIHIRPGSEPDNIRDRIRAAFHRNANICADGISVMVEGQKVVLSGIVQSWFEKKEAKKAAWSAPGIAEVDDRIEIRVRGFM